MVQGGTAPQPLMQGSQMDSLKSSAEEIHNRLGVNSWWGLCSGFPLSLSLTSKKKVFPWGVGGMDPDHSRQSGELQSHCV